MALIALMINVCPSSASKLRPNEEPWALKSCCNAPRLNLKMIEYDRMILESPGRGETTEALALSICTVNSGFVLGVLANFEKKSSGLLKKYPKDYVTITAYHSVALNLSFDSNLNEHLDGSSPTTIYRDKPKSSKIHPNKRPCLVAIVGMRLVYWAPSPAVVVASDLAVKKPDELQACKSQVHTFKWKPALQGTLIQLGPTFTHALHLPVRCPPGRLGKLRQVSGHRTITIVHQDNKDPIWSNDVQLTFLVIDACRGEGDTIPCQCCWVDSLGKSDDRKTT